MEGYWCRHAMVNKKITIAIVTQSLKKYLENHLVCFLLVRYLLSRYTQHDLETLLSAVLSHDSTAQRLKVFTVDL